MKKNHLLYLLPFALLLAQACQSGQENSQAEQETEEVQETTPEHNALTQEEMADGWELLFDGKTADKWRVFKKDSIFGWEVKDGELIAMGTGQSADIITKKQYSNFELAVDWKISAAGNSGIFFNVVEDDAYNTVYETGPEYQLVDDLGFPEKLEDWQTSGANYGMHPPSRKAAKPQGEFNHSRIVVNNGHVEHWLNGEKVVEYELWTPEWEEMIQKGKWKDYPGYGKAKEGHIALQDHGNMIWFRNIKIKEL